ncbi:MAG: type VI secretion system ATPase TssH [Gammaproteobacteria bacterium]|nr:type VI secretion system ATPase TssH [Gammaproteobacteria bacterium]
MIDVDLKALLSKLNATCISAMEGAAGLCVSRGNYEILPEHVLLKLLENPNGEFQTILRHYEIDSSRVEKALQRAIEDGRTGNQGKPVFSPLLIEWFQEAWLIASVDLKQTKVTSGTLVATLLSNPRRYGQSDYFDIFHHLSAEDLRNNLPGITADSTEQTGIEESQAGVKGATPVRGGDSALAKFTIDFTAQARDDKIDPVFARDREIRQMIDILGRRRKNNPIAVGEAGVGKTAVIEGLALKIVQGDVPEILQDVDIIGLDLGLLQAGASVKGEFENRLKAVIEEVKASPKPIILFIDEAHTLIGAGGPAGGGDAANLLKPALARGELRTIAATTWSEYKKYFEKDPALARRFQLVKLDEPTPKDAVTIIRGLREKYEQAHGVYIRDDGVEAAALMSARYITGRQLPDKAVDVLDTACARVKISISAKPDCVEDRERRIAMLQRESGAIQRDIDSGITSNKEKVIELEETISRIQEELAAYYTRWEKEKAAVEKVVDVRQKYAEFKAGESTDESTDIKQLSEELETSKTALASIQESEPLIHYEVGPEVVSAVISDWTGIPLGNIARDEAKSVLSFGNNLRKRIKGQDHAIDSIHEGLQAAKAGLNNPNTPMGVFLFVGPSGVGKTETALGVADLLFGGERFMTAINMSEFQEKHSVSRLVGSPPGYVGYGEGGVLTEAVRQRPYSVVLLDEVEKADLEVMNLFYQVFDKGTLSDGEGRVIDFKNTIVLLTSNLATDLIMQLCSQQEFPDVDTLREAIHPILSKHFKPALLARMNIIPFFPIAGDALKEIVALKLKQVGKRLLDNQQMQFEYDEKVVDQIAERCTEVESGARNVDHIINRTMLPQISTELLQQISSESKPSRLNVSIDDNGDFKYDFLS